MQACEDALLASRSEFPALEHSVYMISHSQGAMPRGAATALDEFGELWVRKAILAWEDWMDAAQKAAARIEQILGAAPGTVQMATNVSEVQARVASCWNTKNRAIASFIPR